MDKLSRMERRWVRKHLPEDYDNPGPGLRVATTALKWWFRVLYAVLIASVLYAAAHYILTNQPIR